jgi:hypothetical protein
MNVDLSLLRYCNTLQISIWDEGTRQQGSMTQPRAGKMIPNDVRNPLNNLMYYI